LSGSHGKAISGSINALALSPDGKTIACGNDHGSVQQWDTDGEIKGVWATVESAVASLSWSHFGGYIASRSLDGTILIRKSDDGEVKVGQVETNQCLVNSVAYSPSGDRFASGGDGTIRIWDSKTGEPLVNPVEDLRGIVSCIMIV
jgi:WD40 repeat protein